MKAYKLTVLIVDHGGLGADGIKTELESVNFPNDCMRPKLMAIEEADIGEWNDGHFLNYKTTLPGEFERLFPPKETAQKYTTRRNMTQERFIARAISIHGNKYDYSKVNFIDLHGDVKIICQTHGVFEQQASNHIYGRNGCPKCFSFSNQKTTEQFILEAKAIHGDRYDYSLVSYVGWDRKVTIVCYLHGSFEQTPYRHLRSKGCMMCTHDAQRRSQEEWITIAKTIHGDFYDYSQTIYLGNKKKLTIICPLHGKFNQEANNHTGGHGCPKCKRYRRKGSL